MFTLNLTVAELLNAACHSEMQLCTRAALGAGQIVLPSCWPSQRIPQRSHLEANEIREGIQRAFDWCWL